MTIIAVSGFGHAELHARQWANEMADDLVGHGRRAHNSVNRPKVDLSNDPLEDPESDIAGISRVRDKHVAGCQILQVRNSKKALRTLWPAD